jgi:hypothetical protein
VIPKCDQRHRATEGDLLPKEEIGDVMMEEIRG